MPRWPSRTVSTNPSGGDSRWALVLQHNLALHARDRHFDHLPQIVRV
jgi:hypothetical protein